jgi:hypothetical protein
VCSFWQVNSYIHIHSLARKATYSEYQTSDSEAEEEEDIKPEIIDVIPVKAIVAEYQQILVKRAKLAQSNSKRSVNSRSRSSSRASVGALVSVCSSTGKPKYPPLT